MKRGAYQEQLAHVPLQQLVFLDECGFSLALYRLYGWVIGGGHCVETVPLHLQRGQAHWVVGAFSLPTPDCHSGLRALWQKFWMTKKSSAGNCVASCIPRSAATKIREAAKLHRLLIHVKAPALVAQRLEQGTQKDSKPKCLNSGCVFLDGH